MSGLPFFQFYPGDWVKDTRALSPEGKGAWIDILCALHISQTRGKLAMTLEGWARTVGQSPEKTRACIDELRLFGTCDHTECNGLVTLISRRMLRESITKEQTRQRVAKLRYKQRQGKAETAKQRKSNAQCNAPVSECNGEEARNQKPETRNQDPILPPGKPAGVDASKPARKPRPRTPADDLFDAIGAATGVNGAACGGEVAAARKAILSATPDVTPAEIERRAANYRKNHPDWTISPGALAKWWPECNGTHETSQLSGLVNQ